ncbi:hypothetical protein ACOME3_008900 [Neoechinorhynchus agilis]
MATTHHYSVALMKSSLLLLSISHLGNCARECNAIAGMECLCSSSLDCKVTDPLTSLHVKTSDTFKSIRLTFQSKALVIPANFFTPINKLLDYTSIGNNDFERGSVVSSSSSSSSDHQQLLVHITFPRFDVLALDNFAFANLFGDRIPLHIQNRTKLSIDFYSEKTVTAYPDTFSDLKVGHLELYGAFFTAPSVTSASSLSVPTFATGSPITLENLFNHSSISQMLRLEGIMLPSAGIVTNFQGHINRLLVSKQVSQISASEFPFYGVVNFYTIFAHNARSIDGLSFASYTNLKGLMIHSGQLHLNGNALVGLSHLKELMLDLEKVNNGALVEVANTLELLELKGRVRHIDDACLNSLHRLKVLDIRDLDFYILSYSTRCLLAQFISARLKQLDVLVSAKINEPVEVSCECHLLFILTLKRIPHHCNQKDVIEKCAIYATCNIVRIYFQELKNIESYSGNNVMVVNSSSLLSMIRDQQRQQNAAAQPEIKGQPHRQSPVEPVVLDIGDAGIPANDDSTAFSAVPAGGGGGGGGSSSTLGIVWPLPDAIRKLTTTPPSLRYPTPFTQSTELNIVGHREIANFKWVPVVIICVTLVVMLVLALGLFLITYKRRYRQFKPVSSNGSGLRRA